MIRRYQQIGNSGSRYQYVENQRDVLRSANSCGISGSVYTQITDVEGELNGFFSYDRQVTKMDTAQVRAVNESIIRNADGTQLHNLNAMHLLQPNRLRKQP